MKSQKSIGPLSRIIQIIILSAFVLVAWLLIPRPGYSGHPLEDLEPMAPGQLLEGEEMLGFAYQLPGGLVTTSSPTLADLTGDGIPEIIVGTSMQSGVTWQHTRPASLTALRSDGSILWTREFNAPIGSTPAVGDINADGQPEVVVGLGGDAGNIHHPGGVVALRADGTQLWRYETNDYYPSDGMPDAVYSSPALCQMDGDPQAEIAFGSWDQRIHLIDHNGNALWADMNWPGKGYFNADTIWSSPACADLNGDGIDELIIGADIKGGGYLPDGTATVDGGFLYVFAANGQVLVRRHVPETIYSSPAVADINCDGRMEIVVGTGEFYYYDHGQTEQPYVYAFSTANVFTGMAYADPNKLPDLPGWPQPTHYPGMASPALGDLDLDGDLEIVISRSKRGGASLPYLCNQGNGDCYSAIYAWHHDGQPVNGFPIWPLDGLGKNSSTNNSPIIANIDGDPNPEILHSMLWDVLAIGPTGQIENRYNTQWMVGGSPAVGDTDGDGQLDLWAGGSHMGNPSHGYLWKFPLAGATHKHLPWPMFRQSPDHLGLYPTADSLVVSSPIPDHNPGGGAMASGVITVHNPGPVAHGYTVGQLPARVTTTHPTGAVGVGQTRTVPLTINTAGLPRGITPLGGAAVHGHGPACTAGQQNVANLNLRIMVGEFEKLRLPVIYR